MSKAKRNALAVLFTAVALFMFAALLCLGFPMEAKAESGEAAYGASVNTFTAEMPEGYLANNVSDAAAADGSSAEETVVANITRGGQTLEFFTVQGAIDAAQDGETIKIPSCSAITEEITVASGKNIKINLLSEVTLGGTFVNNGTVAIDISAGTSSRYKPSVFDATITNNAGAELSIDINYAAIGPRYAELKGTVSNSGTLTLTGTGNCNAQITNATGGVLTVKSNLNVYDAITNSGTFTIANGTYNGNIVNNGGTIAIQGGNFTQEQKEAFGDYLAEGYRWTLSSTAGNFSAIAEESVVYTLTRDGAEYGFASLSAALTAADEGETIVLEKPYSIKTPNSTQKLNKSVTVDLNGKKISTQSRFEATTAGTDITVKNGSIVYTGNGSNATYVGFRVSGGASLTLDGVSVDWSSIDSGRAAEVGVSNTSAAGTLILKNGSVLKGGEVGVFLAGTKDADTENKTALYAEDSIIESVATASAGVMTNGSTYNTVIELVNTDVSGTLAIYQPSKNSTLTIDGGTMRGNTGIEIRNGTLTVKGGAEIVATGEYKVSETPSSGGSTVSGAALAVTKYENDGTLTVNIEGGTFRAESENGVAFCERNPEAADGTHSPGNVPSVSITGGIFEGGVSAVNVQKFIEGGTFTAEGDISDYLADGLTTNEDGTVVPDALPNAVAKVKLADGTVKYYERLADAFLAAKDGATVDILKDVKQTAESALAVGYYNGEGGVWLYIQDKSLTINGNGYTLTCTTAAWAMYILNNDKTGQIETLTINDLTIDVTTPKVQSNAAKVISCSGIVLWHGETNLTLNNVTVNTEACGVKNATALSVAGNGKNTTITTQGGAFKAAQDTGYAFMANNPVQFTAEDTEFSGWAAIYLRCGKVTSGSAALGTSGSVVTLTNTKLYGYGKNPDGDNNFGVIVLNDGGITVNVIGGSVNLAPAEGAMMQSVVYYSTSSGANPSTSKVTFEDTDVTLTGSNTVFVWGNFNQNAGGDVTVAGGTFNFAVTENYLAEGYAPLLQADGTYAVVDREDAVAAGQAVAALSTTDIYGREVQVLYSTLQAAVNAAKEGDTVTLLANVTESIEIAQGQDIVLDLNGKTLTNAAGSHTVTNYGTLTIVGEGTVDNKDNGRAAVFNAQGGTAYLNSGTYTRSAEASTDFDSANGNSYYVILNQGTMTIGTETTSPTVCFPEGRGYFSSLVENGWFTASQNTAKVNASLMVNNGTFTGGKHSFKNDSYGELVINNATVFGAGSDAILNWNILTVNDGSFTGDIGAVLTAGSGADYESGNTKIYGGEFTGVLAIDSSYNVAEYSVSGGTFSEALPAEYLAAECAQMSADGTFTVGTTESLVTEQKAVAMNAETGMAYTSLQEAFDAVEGEATITLLADIVYGKNEDIKAQYDGEYPIGDSYPQVYYSIGVGKTITLDMNGKTIDFRTASIGSTSGSLLLKNLGDLTITGNGKVLSSTIDAMVLIGVFEGASLTVESGTFDTSYAAIYMSQNAEANVLGGTFQSTCFTWFVSYIALEDGAALNIGKADTVGGPQFIAPENVATGGAFSVYAAGAPWKDGEENNTDGITVNIYDGTFGSPVGLYEDGCAVQANIYGGTFAEAVAWDMNAGEAITGSVVLGQFVDGEGKVVLNVTGGTFEGALVKLAEEGDIAISGTAAFANMPPFSYFKDGYAAVWNEDEQMYVTEEGVSFVAAVGENGYVTLAEAVAKAAGSGEEVTLLANVTESIEIAQGKEIVLDLNGKTLTNAAGSHTVTNYGTLTIVGNGTVTNVSGSCGALVNYGEATLLGGTFTRTKDENENWYIIKNYGAMTIGEEGQEGSVTVESELTAGAALITNGYFDAADRSDHSGHVTVAAENACTLTIYGGTFSGGAITLKNDDLGKATIAGGSFTNGGEVAIQNSYQMTITGGSFEQTNSAGRTLVATSVNYAAEASTTISDGTFTSAGYVVANGLNNPNNSYPATAAMDISGGTFRTTSSTASAVYVFTGGNLTVTGGEFYGGSGSGYGINFRGGAGTTLAVSGADTYIEARNGIYVLTAGATVELADATVKATNRSLYFSRSDSITVTSGEYTGEVYMIPGSDTQASISGGTFNGAITVNTGNAELTGFISGGRFKQQPAAEYMDPDYIAEYRDGFYVPVESSALYIAQKEAQADIRAYAASLGIAWSDVVAAADPENASPYQAEAELVMNAYNAIDAAASERQVADAKLEAMGALDVLYDAIKDAEQQAEAELAEIKQGYITELQTLAKGSETLAEVVVPTATYLAINNAETAEEAEFYYNNAVKEIEDIRAYRTAIAGQADQLTELAETLVALNTSLFGTEGEGGAFNGLLGDIEKAIKDAQNAIVNGAAGEEGTTSASLAGIQDYLEKTIKAALDGITRTLEGATKDLTAIKGSIDGLDVSGQLAKDFQAVLDKIAAAQGAIMGATEEGAGVSIADAVNEVNKATAAAVTGLREELVGTDGTRGKLGSLATTVGALQGLLEDRDSGLEAIATKIDAAKDAILGAASGDGGSATGLQAVLEAVNGVNEVTDQVFAAVQGLADTENGVAAQIKGELAGMLEAIEGLTGALATSGDVAGVKEDIKSAQAEIDKIVAAIGSLGTAEGNDLAAKIEQVVGSLAAVQGTVGSIAESVNASTTVEAVKGDAMTDIAAWLNEYLDDILGTAGEAGSGVAAVRAFTAETTEGDIYAKLAQAFSEDNAKLVLKYYNDALAAIDAATTVSEVTTAVSTFKAQVASVEAAAQNVTDVDLTGVYVLLAILVVAVAVVIVVMILKRRQQPAVQEAAVQEAAPVQAQAAPEPVTREVAVTDDDKEQVVIAANVRSFSEAYVDLSQELRELFNKVRAYALGKENAVEVRQSTGVCVKRNGKQIVKLTVRRNAPVALFFLENEMLKDFRRESGSQSKLKVHATELILREEADLAAAYKMVDLSLEQIDKDIAAKKERAKELRRLRRQQKAEQSKKDGAES